MRIMLKGVSEGESEGGRARWIWVMNFMKTYIYALDFLYPE